MHIPIVIIELLQICLSKRILFFPLFSSRVLSCELCGNFCHGGADNNFKIDIRDEFLSKAVIGLIFFFMCNFFLFCFISAFSLLSMSIFLLLFGMSSSVMTWDWGKTMQLGFLANSLVILSDHWFVCSFRIVWLITSLLVL